MKIFRGICLFSRYRAVLSAVSYVIAHVPNACPIKCETTNQTELTTLKQNHLKFKN